LLRPNGLSKRWIPSRDGRDAREMNSQDEIVNEVRATREAYAARFNFDLAEIFKDLKAKEQVHQRDIALLQPLAPKPDAAISR
jgi:hypothetical protein